MRFVIKGLKICKQEMRNTQKYFIYYLVGTVGQNKNPSNSIPNLPLKNIQFQKKLHNTIKREYMNNYLIY